MREAENIREVEELGIDWLGFIFWPKSSRYVAERPAYLPTRCKRVGVFVDADIEDVLQHIEDYGLDAVQLHGHETPDYIRTLRTAAVPSATTRSVHCGIAAVPTAAVPTAAVSTIIKAISVSTRADIALTEPYAGLVDYFLFDTRKPPEETGGWHPPGGTGEKFDWAVLADYAGQTPFLLSGGIGPDDREPLSHFHHPMLAGIDLNSRFELRPAFKDINKLKHFLYEQD